VARGVRAVVSTTHVTMLPDLLLKFQSRYSEFSGAGLSMITAALEDARTELEGLVFGDADDLVCMAKAAIILATGPGGNPMRIKGSPESTYQARLDALILQYACASRPQT
jgi:hypothetical protein